MKSQDLLIVAAGVVVVYAASRAASMAADAAAQAAADAAQAINPLNRDNIFYGGVNAVGGALVTDPAGPGKNADGSWSLGGWIYDVTHPTRVF